MAQAGGKSLVVRAEQGRLTDGGDDCLGVLDGERVDGGAVFLSDPSALESKCRIVPIRMVSAVTPTSEA